MIDHGRGAGAAKTRLHAFQVTGNARQNKYLTPRDKDAKINLIVINDIALRLGVWVRSFLSAGGFPWSAVL